MVINARRKSVYKYEVMMYKKMVCLIIQNTEITYIMS